MGQGINIRTFHTAHKLHAGDNVPPLIITAHLQTASVFLKKDQKIIGLQQLVIELYKRESGFQANLVGFETKHTVYGKMPADVAQKLDVIKARQPVGIVHQNGVVAGKIDETRNLFFQHFPVLFYCVYGKHPAHFAFT